jgi:hypothetical protein
VIVEYGGNRQALTCPDIQLNIITMGYLVPASQFKPWIGWVSFAVVNTRNASAYICDSPLRFAVPLGMFDLRLRVSMPSMLTMIHCLSAQPPLLRVSDSRPFRLSSILADLGELTAWKQHSRTSLKAWICLASRLRSYPTEPVTPRAVLESVS